jgi:amino acid transporter
VEALAYLVPVIVFLVLYVVLRRRAGRRGTAPPVRWGRLAAIIGCALAAVLVGVLLG